MSLAQWRNCAGDSGNYSVAFHRNALQSQPNFVARLCQTPRALYERLVEVLDQIVGVFETDG